MATLDERLKDEEYCHWVKSVLCLQYTKDGLVSFASRKSQDLHNAVFAQIRHSGNPSAHGLCSTASVDFKRRAIKCCTNCNAFLVETKKYCTGALNLNNFDIKDLHKQPWQLAKLFMNPGQDITNTIPGQTDLSGILNFVDYCTLAKMAILNAANINAVRDTRNRVLHTADMKVTKQDFSTKVIPTLIALLQDPWFLATDPAAQEAVVKINEVVAADFHITKENEEKVLKELATEFRCLSKDLNTKIDDVQTELNRMETNIGQTMKAQDDKLEKEVQDRKKDKQTTLQQMKAQHDRLENELQDKEKDKQELEKTLQKLEQKIKGDAELVRTLGTDMITIKTSLEKTRQDINKLTSKTGEREREHEQLRQKQADMAAEQEDMAADIENTRQDIDKLTSKNEEREREHEQLKRKQADMAAIQTDMAADIENLSKKDEKTETLSVTEEAEVFCARNSEEEDKDDWRKKARNRLPGPLDDDVYDMILQVLQGKIKMSDIKKKDRKSYHRKAYRRLQTGAYSIQNVQNPLAGSKEIKLIHTQSSKIVVKKSEIPEMVKKVSQQTRGEGAKKIRKRLTANYASVSQQRIQRELNRDPAQQRRYPLFKNMAPLRPVKSSNVMVRNQIDLVDFRNIAVTIDDQKFQWVLSVMDLYSRFVWLRALQTKSSDEVAMKLRDIYSEFGTPKYLQSDQGREFKGAVERLCKSLNIKIIHSSAYHPQSQGKIERSNRTWKQKIQDDLLRLEDGLCWLDFLPRYQKIYNEAQHEALGPFSPFEIFYGRQSRSDQDILVLGKDCLDSEAIFEVEERQENDPTLRWPSSSDDDAEDIDDLIVHLKSMKELRKKAESNSEKASQGMIKRNLRKNPPSRYEIGDGVIVQVKRKDNRLKKGSTNLTVPRVCRGTITEVNYTNYRYKVKTDEGKHVWFKVNQITSLTKEEENFRQRVQNGKAKCSCKAQGCDKNYEQNCVNKMSRMCCFCVGDKPCFFHLSTLSSPSDLNFLLRMKTMEKKKLSSGSDYDNLIRNALEFGLIERGTTPADGNCMFHCLSAQLSEILHRRISHSDVRKDCVNFLRENPRTTDGTPLSNFVIGNNLESYLVNMENEAWGDNLMMFAASHVYGVGIMVVSSLGDRATQFIHRTSVEMTTEESARDMILLGHLAESHYISLEPLQRLDYQSDSEGENSRQEFTAESILAGSSEPLSMHTRNVHNDVTRSSYNIDLSKIEEEIRNSIISETSGNEDDNTINHFRDIRQEGTIPVCINNARVIMFLTYMESKGRQYKHFNSAYGSFVCVPEEDMATFDEKSLYMEAGKTYRLDSKPFRFWLANVCPNERRVNMTFNNHDVVEIPADIVESFDTWYDQLRLRISLALNQ